jgi:deoxyribose-phosphate aldolase
MNIKKYLDSTYLKTADQAGLDEKDNVKWSQVLFKKLMNISN